MGVSSTLPFCRFARSLIDFVTSEKVTLVVYAPEVASVPASVALVDRSGKILIEHSVTETAKDTLPFSFTFQRFMFHIKMTAVVSWNFGQSLSHC